MAKKEPIYSREIDIHDDKNFTLIMMPAKEYEFILPFTNKKGDDRKLVVTFSRADNNVWMRVKNEKG